MQVVDRQGKTLADILYADSEADPESFRSAARSACWRHRAKFCIAALLLLVIAAVVAFALMASKKKTTTTTTTTTWKANQCICNGGTAVPPGDKRCTTDGAEVCASCNAGYILDSGLCKATTTTTTTGFGCTTGSATGCATCVSQDARTSGHTCATCIPGFELQNTTCNPFGCTTGADTSCASCVNQSERTDNHTCATCNSGYVLDKATCKADPCPSMYGYSFDHFGDWTEVFIPGHTTETVETCAQRCNAMPTCAAMNFYISGSSEGQCYLYSSVGGSKRSDKEQIACIKKTDPCPSGYRFDHQGDWTKFENETTGETAASCGQRCNNNDVCVGINFYISGGSEGACYLYSSLGDARVNDVDEIACVRENPCPPGYKYDHPGDWLNYRNETTGETAVSCGQRCEDDETCVAINFYVSGGSQGACFLYTSVGDARPEDGQIACLREAKRPTSTYRSEMAKSKSGLAKSPAAKPTRSGENVVLVSAKSESKSRLDLPKSPEAKPTMDGENVVLQSAKSRVGGVDKSDATKGTTTRNKAYAAVQSKRAEQAFI